MSKNSLSLTVREQADRWCVLEDLNHAPVDLNILRDFTDFCSPHISRSSAQEAINQMTFKLFTHPMTAFSVPDIVVPIARAGMGMWSVANRLFDNPAACFAIGKKTKGTSKVEVVLSSGMDVEPRSILILDTVIATGDTIIAVAQALRERSPLARIEVASCYAAPGAIDAILSSSVVEYLSVTLLAQDCRDGWLIPKINGDAGDKLYGVRL